MTTSPRPTRLVLIAATFVAAACGGSRGATTPQTTPSPAATPTVQQPPATSPGAGQGGAGAQVDTGRVPTLWSIGEPACPAGPAQASAGAAAPGDTMMRTGTTLGDTSARKPAIILRAAVAAREVRFAKQPQIVVRLCGGTLDSVRVIERRNLPRPVGAGTTYRDIFVAVEILGHLDAACIASTLTGGGTGRAGGPCGSLSFTDSAGATRRTATPP